MTKNSEIENIKEKIIPILKEHKISKAGIFGSFARGEQHKKSDVDILVEMPEEWSLLEVAHLKGLLELALRKKVDLVEYAGIRKELRENILGDEIQIL